MIEQETKPEFDWIVFSLLCAMVLISAWALSATEWVDFLYMIPLTGLAGVLAGTALGRSRFSGRVATVFAMAYGFFIAGWQLGSTLDPALTWASRARQLSGRMGLFFSRILAGEPNEDGFVFVIIMAALFWIMGSWSG